MNSTYSRTRGGHTALATAAGLLLCAACASLPAPASAPLSMGGTPVGSAAHAAGETREIRLGGAVQGTLAARGDTDDYTLQVQAGQAFSAVLEVPHQQPESQLRVQVFRQDRVTSELLFVKATIVGSADGEAGSTPPIQAEGGAYVVRVQGLDGQYGGRYSLRVLPTHEGTISLGQTVRGELDGRGDADDYTLVLPAGARINARLGVPYTGKATSLQVYLYRRDPVTRELHFETSAIVESDAGQPGATRPVASEQGGTYVARVQGMDLRYGGRYELTVERL